jgi:hypothetical protein
MMKWGGYAYVHDQFCGNITACAEGAEKNHEKSQRLWVTELRFKPTSS